MANVVSSDLYQPAGLATVSGFSGAAAGLGTILGFKAIGYMQTSLELAAEIRRYPVWKISTR